MEEAWIPREKSVAVATNKGNSCLGVGGRIIYIPCEFPLKLSVSKE